MEHGPGEQPPPDERAVLDDLEHLHEQIEQSKAHRAGLQEQFQTFLRRFDPPALPADVEPPEQRDRGTVPATPAGLAPGDAATDGASGASIQPDATDFVRQGAAARLDNGRTRSRGRRIVVGGVALLLAGGAAAWALRGRTPAPDPATYSSVPQPSPAPPAPPPAPTPESVPITETAITTERAVWLRVLVDGARVVEREVPAGTRLPFDPRESLVIRTGDAGAVRLSIRGEDQGLLGREGEVVTRTFTLAPTAER